MKLYSLIYAATGEVLGTGLSYTAAQGLANVWAEGMHPEQAADLVIREQQHG